MLHPSSRAAAPVLLLACLVAAPATAKDKEPPPRPAQIQQLYDCRDIADSAARLACFDREVGALAAADQAREITFTDRETAKKVRRGLFGFSFPDLGGIFGDDDEEEITRIETAVDWARIDRSNKYTIGMADGAVWSQIDTTRLPREPKPGQKVTIKAASMGSYFVSVDGQRSIRMKRDR